MELRHLLDTTTGDQQWEQNHIHKVNAERGRERRKGGNTKERSVGHKAHVCPTANHKNGHKTYLSMSQTVLCDERLAVM